MKETQRHIDCLVLLQTFEMYWAYYSVSDGQIYADACRKSAGALAEAMKALLEAEPERFSEEGAEAGEASDTAETADRLADWEHADAVAPFENMYESIRRLSPVFHRIKTAIFRRLDVHASPVMQMNREELMYREGVQRWQAHLPTMVVMGKESPEDLLQRASADRSIAVVGNIRHIDDLFCHAEDPAAYAAFLDEYLGQIRVLVDEYMGIFDKFDGDGFRAYFSKAICDIINLDLTDCFVNFVRDVTAFSADLFQRWERTLRKRPADPPGVCIGADAGRLLYRDVVSQLMVAGHPLIWARRLARLAGPGEIIVNNLLWNQLESHPEVETAEKTGSTECGEAFRIGSMTFP